jgi:hypothetical protein
MNSSAADERARPRRRADRKTFGNFHSINGLAFADMTETHPQNHHFGYALAIAEQSCRFTRGSGSCPTKKRTPACFADA